MPAKALAQQTAPRRPGFIELSQRALLEAYAPASVLINGKHEGLYYFGSVDRYLKVAAGEDTRDVLAMAREGLRANLRSALQRAKEDRATVTLTGAQLKRNGSSVGVGISARPIESAGEGLFLVSFVEGPAPEVAPVGPVELAADVSRVAQLEQDFEATREDLHSAIRDLEIANLEQKAINEEAMSVNEEFQSTNEELETSKEADAREAGVYAMRYSLMATVAASALAIGIGFGPAAAFSPIGNTVDSESVLLNVQRGERDTHAGRGKGIRSGRSMRRGDRGRRGTKFARAAEMAMAMAGEVWTSTSTAAQLRLCLRLRLAAPSSRCDGKLVLVAALQGMPVTERPRSGIASINSAWCLRSSPSSSPLR